MWEGQLFDLPGYIRCDSSREIDSYSYFSGQDYATCRETCHGDFACNSERYPIEEDICTCTWKTVCIIVEYYRQNQIIIHMCQFRLMSVTCLIPTAAIIR